ncbi:MAG: DegT/DnrJ/EryC1/StrS family aminotransferase [Bacteroidota bacterium]
MTPIPILDLGPDIEAHADAYRAAFERVLHSGRFIGGPEVAAFEDEVAAYTGARHAVGLNSGTDALVIALRALGIGAGDEVITTPFTFFSTAEAISLAGATPVFVDIDAPTFNLDASRLEAAVTERTRAVLPVHLFGLPAAMAQIVEVAERHSLRIIEDAAQSFGARYAADGDQDRLGGRMTGTIGDAGTLSFFPSKTLGAFGDGGMLLTDDDAVAETVRKLRAHGGARKYHNEMLGYNSRLDALQAALLREKLPRLDAANASRRASAHRYTEALAGTSGLVVPEVAPGHVFHQYTVRVLDGRRDAIREALVEAGIQTMVYYPTPVHQLPVYAEAGFPAMPVAERLAAEVLSLPMGPDLSEADQDRVVRALRTALR